MKKILLFLLFFTTLGNTANIELQASYFRNRGIKALQKYSELIKNEKNKENRNILKYQRDTSCLLNTALVLMEAIKNNQECYGYIVKTRDKNIRHSIPVVFSDNRYRWIDIKFSTISLSPIVFTGTSSKLEFSSRWIKTNLSSYYTEFDFHIDGVTFFILYFDEIVRRFHSVIDDMGIKDFYYRYIDKNTKE